MSDTRRKSCLGEAQLCIYSKPCARMQESLSLSQLRCCATCSLLLCLSLNNLLWTNKQDIATMVQTVGHNLVKPSAYFKPIAQPTSNSPATIRIIQFMLLAP